MWEMGENFHARVRTRMIVNSGAEDTIFQLRGLLSKIEEAQLLESALEDELASVKRQMADVETATEGFYSEMYDDSIERAKKLIAYRHRVKELLERLAAFIRVQDRDAGYWD